jgi:hypothetical protein
MLVDVSKWVTHWNNCGNTKRSTYTVMVPMLFQTNNQHTLEFEDEDIGKVDEAPGLC